MPRVASVVVSHPTAAMMFVAAVTGCAAPERGEHVFTRQNQAASALAMIAMDAEMRGSKETDQVYAAEARLSDACALLSEAAAQKMRGETLHIEFEMMVLNSLDECAAETKRSEQFIWRANPELAKFYLGEPPMILSAPH